MQRSLQAVWTGGRWDTVLPEKSVNRSLGCSAGLRKEDNRWYGKKLGSSGEGIVLHVCSFVQPG